MLKEATAIVAERRGPEIAALRTEQGRQGVFAWAGGGPRAGQRAVLAYNKAHGPLRWACFTFILPSAQAPLQHHLSDTAKFTTFGVFMA